MMNNKILIGKIVGTSGIKGYVRIHTFTKHPGDIESFAKLFTEQNNHYKVQRIVSIKGNVVIVQLHNIDSIENAEQLINTELFVLRSDLENLFEDEYYYDDLIQCKVYFENNELYGVIVNVTNYGASDILEIKECDSNKIILYPFADEFIVKVDLNQKMIIVKQLNAI